MFDLIRLFVIEFKAARDQRLALIIFVGGVLLGRISAAVLEVKNEE